MIWFELCHWRQLCGDQCNSEVVFCSPPSQRAAMLLSYRNKRYLARPMYLFMHIHICRSYRKTNQIPKTPPPSVTPLLNTNLEDPFAASHPCSSGWPLGRPLLKDVSPATPSFSLAMYGRTGAKTATSISRLPAASFQILKVRKTSAKSMWR